MLSTSIGWILIASGLITAGGGLAAFFSPKTFLQLGFGDNSPTSSAVFFVRHWGVLIIAVGALTVYSAHAPEIRIPVLIAAALEKFAIGLLVLFGPLKRTIGMTAIGFMDGLFAVLYMVYLAGVFTRGVNY
jgi:hypothetical protein